MPYRYINENQIDVELKCSICDEPLQSPVNCRSCGYTYCQGCIEKWMTRQASCPSCRQQGNQFLPVISRVVLNQLNRLLVQCDLCERSNIERGNFNDHMSSTCPKQIVDCTDNCGWKGMRENLEEHVQRCRLKKEFSARMWPVLKKILIFLAIVLAFYLSPRSSK
ncbi:unnamed protein product [Adineta ricciae]|uniref:RING-type domain-containing protein n=1 Tax=Adineta ricciae TaxID=249248 RepID=A0A814URP7_ADIRI|nr:unnamed protein product [Adineta ricciae]